MDLDGWQVVVGLINESVVDEAVFDGLVDYAGLFPPTSFSMGKAVTEYQDALQGMHSRRVDRFVCLASRLGELASELSSRGLAGGPWAVSVIADVRVEQLAGVLAEFGVTVGPSAEVAMIECRLQFSRKDSLAVAVSRARATVRGVLSAAPSALAMFEVAPTSRKLRRETARLGVAVISQLRNDLGASIGAKLRCGGVEAADFPGPGVVAQFIASCIAEDVPFKATAGLHHPVRHFDIDLGVMRHGFLNLLVATSASQNGAAVEELVQILRQTDEKALIDLAKGIDPAVLRKGFLSYGSCDFAEPMEELASLGLVS